MQCERQIFAVLPLIVFRWITTCAQEQNYFFSRPQDQYELNYQPSHNGYLNLQPSNSFHKSGPSFANTYRRHPDLDTSDLSPHLQRSLPQYHLDLFQNPIDNQPNNPYNSPFNPNPQLTPSTLRPSFSHVFSKHNHDPSQTETFLGQITLQSPAQLPPEFHNKQATGFQPSVHFPNQYVVDQVTPSSNRNLVQKPSDKRFKAELDYTEKPSTQQLKDTSRFDYLNHRTRIFAPESGKKLKDAQVNNYFVNNNGEVFMGDKKNASAKSFSNLQTPRRKNFEPSMLGEETNLSGRATEKENKNLDYLYEEPLEKDEHYSNEDHVDVIQSSKPSVTTENVNESAAPNYDEFSEYEYENDYDDSTTLDSKEDTTEQAEIFNSTETSTSRQNNSILAQLVMQNKDENFVDTTEIDTTTYETTKAINDKIDPPKINNSVVSIVTTKSVVNNTIIGTITPNPAVTEKMSPLIFSNAENVTYNPNNLNHEDVSPSIQTNEENSTEGWVVVASVQTSRSISGARYLPFSIVEQHQKTKSLNEPSEEPRETTTDQPSEKQNASTESLIDKLDRVQSDLSSSLLTSGFNNGVNNIAVITEGILDKAEDTTMFDSSIKASTILTTSSTTTIRPSISTSPPVVIRKFSPHARPTVKSRYKNFKTNVPVDMDKPQNDEATKETNATMGRASGISKKNGVIVQDQLKENDLSEKTLANLLGKIKFQDFAAYLPSGYKENQSSINTETNITQTSNKSKNVSGLLENSEEDNITKFLPPGYNNVNSSLKTSLVDEVYSKNVSKKHKQDDTSSRLKNKSDTTTSNLFKKIKQDDISDLLPPGYKPPSEDQSTKTESSNLFKKIKQDDISAFLPPNYKSFKTSSAKPEEQESLLTTEKPHSANNTAVKPSMKTTEKSKLLSDLFEKAREDDISALLPPGFKSRFSPPKATMATSTTTTTSRTTTQAIAKETTSSSSFKLVFPSRPGSASKNKRITTQRTSNDQSAPVNTPPSIHKGWPMRVTTEFTGWPTPLTTPLSIEKLLEAAQAAAAGTSSTTSSTTTTTSTTTPIPTSTTTSIPTTPGLCASECDLAGTIKLTSGAKWVPELLDRNTREWQILANEVQYQLEDVYSKSDVLNKWYKKIRIDGFSEGSVLVDYFVELNNVSRNINTRELKTLFHEALDDAFTKTNREPKASSLSPQPLEGKFSLGNFIVDPTFTDFIVLPKQILPTVGYAEDKIFLPQWAIAIIVIGLASLLFVIIFGVTVLVNKQKNAKKKQPSPLTEDMLNELNKNHMGGLDNYGADDLYNMEDVWNDKPYETKLPKKRSAGSLHDNSMMNIYDSWKSEWNGYYYNTYYGNHPGSSHSGYGRRRSDYDTNF